MLTEIVKGSGGKYGYEDLLTHSFSWVMLIYRYVLDAKFEDMKLIEMLRRVKHEVLVNFNNVSSKSTTVMDMSDKKTIDVRILESKGIGYEKTKKKDKK